MARRLSVPTETDRLISMLVVGLGLVFQPGAAAAGSWETTVKPARKAASEQLSVLLVGNSHILMPGFVKRLKRELRARMRPDRGLRMHSIAKIGTTLTKTRKKQETLTTLRAGQWDVIVLQESTTAFMTGYGRRNFMTAVRWFEENRPAGSSMLLWEPWPQGYGHALYRGRGVWGKWFKKPPKSPEQLYSWISSVTKKAAVEYTLGIAPIGGCWMRVPRKQRPYSRDRYHASGKGLTFIAKVLASSIVATANGDEADDRRIAGMCSSVGKS